MKKMLFFWTSQISGFDKMPFLFLRFCYRNSQNRSLNKWRHQRIRFLCHMSAKNRDINLKCGMPDDQAWVYNMYVFCNFCKFWIWKKSAKNYICFTFLIIFVSSEMTVLKNCLFCVLHFFLFAFCLKSHFCDFSNIYQFSTRNGMTLGHLHQ